MINIIAVFILTVMCFMILRDLTYTYSPDYYYFLWGWIGSIATGFLVNWFVKNIENDNEKKN